MEAMKLFKAEMAKLFTNKGVLISVIAVLLIPIVYAAVMLSATWGPYDNLSNLPVAVVNKDKGAMSGDEPINVGKDLVEEFKESKSLGWKFVSEEDAKKGLKNLDYYMVIEIPEDFSKNVTTVLDPDPKQLELKYIQNEGLNFMAAQVTNSATERIREQLGNKITQTYVENIFAQLGEVADGFKSAADGSEQIHSGTAELKDGTGQLLSALTEKSGDIDKLASGAKQLEAGTGELLTSLTSKQGDISKLANGAKDLNNGTGELLRNLKGKSGDIGKLAAGAKELQGGLSELSKGTGDVLAGLQSAQAGFKGAMDQLGPGSKQLAAGTTQVSSGADALSAGTKEIAAGIKQLAQHPLLASNPDVQKLVVGSQTIADKTAELAAGASNLKAGAATLSGGLDQLDATLSKGLGDLVAGQKQVDAGAKKLAAGSGQLAAGTSEVQSGWNTMTAGVTQLNSGAGQIAAGNQTVNQGWKQLTAGASKLNTGMKQVSDGTGSVQTGWGTLTDGVTKVDEGVGKLNAGSEELAEGLKGGAEKTSALKVTDKNIAMFSSPVNLVQEKVNNYQYYRDSTAPYILSLGLFVGILIMSFVVDFRKPADVTTSGVAWFIGKFLHLSVLAIVQALVVSIFALVFLKLQVGNSIAFILFACVVSLAFLAIVFFLVSIAGNIGRFIAFIFIVLQLSTTGSNLPVEMLPEGLRSMSKFLPLTYTNAGFKAVISLDHMGSAWSNALVVIVLLAVFAVLALVVSAIRKGRPTDIDVAR